ncbi:C4-dicarboxylate ABC transporter [Niveispirillum lacus]|uniref:C4-dicarboxylate ABC transporter n=1 Tax=Niveispirillum lacus TaxID=1981099 RepID=A0A255Z4A2_9PROT|nr:TRAP transporter substrate-binding protein [Niveispirillum lacus]OYQ36286.1 C4-dicarboxylate ABC transporter [Niveispirillum lacus]
MISRRAVLSGTTGLGAAVLLSGCDREGSRVLTSSDTHPSDYPTVQAVNEMGRLLETRTGGRLRIHVYAGGQLGAERDTLEITTFGGLDMNRVNLAPLTAIEPMTVIPSLPFLFRSTAHMRQALDGPVGQAILDSLRPHGMVGLCFYDSGERSFYNTKRPIQTPADLKGLKIRVQNSDLFVTMVKALGADATPMDVGEVYQALVQGVIDGAENNQPSYFTGRHFEAAPFYSLSRHVMAPEILVMSMARWEKLSPADRDLVQQTARESVPFMRTLWDKRVEDATAKLLAGGVKVNEIADIAAFSDLMRPVWDRFVTSPEQKRLVAEIQAMGDSAGTQGVPG